jgi:hypothetical protein
MNEIFADKIKRTLNEQQFFFKKVPNANMPSFSNKDYQLWMKYT